MIGFALLALLGLRGFFSAEITLFRFIRDLLNIIGKAGMCVVSAIMLTKSPEKYRQIVKKFWFVPPVCIVINCILNILNLFGVLFWNVGLSITLIVTNILVAVGSFLAALWCVYPNERPSSHTAAKGANGKTVVTNEVYCGLMKHVLLLLFTFGIWNFIWIYRTTKYLNCVEDEEPRNPTTKLLLCLFVPFYSIYWIYKSAQRIDKLAKTKGISSDIATLCLILAIFVGIIPPILMQDKINAIVTARGIAVSPQIPATPDELKKYKELLDNGVITQEEFEAKKKQLLNL